MTVRLVARVRPNDLHSTILYPHDDESEERVAMLAGIIQLVSAALVKSTDSDDGPTLRFMKSDDGVIGYCKQGDYVIICEGDSEEAATDAIQAVLDNPGASPKELGSKLSKVVHDRGKEIGDLWR
ncbi:MAG: hypothetical protein BAJATHORv1_10645 [Candidatus Thorarchaeota archaeon]|nr:MAG: hypothetical protein BAJATHORv1_10645 [Candidatus Thorarchaeota archaeon]